MTEYGPPVDIFIPAVAGGPAPPPTPTPEPGTLASPDAMVEQVIAAVDVAEDEALVELNRRYRLLYRRANPLAAEDPPELVLGVESLIHLDPDLWTHLVEGVTATFLRRDGEGDPPALEARYEAAGEEQYRRNRRAEQPAPESVQQMIDQVRLVLPDVTATAALEEINERHRRMVRHANPLSTTMPAAVTVASAVSSLQIDPDLVSALIVGVIATFQRRAGQVDPGPLEGRFVEAANELLSRRSRTADETSPYSVQALVNRVRRAVGDVPQSDVVEELNHRHLDMWLDAHRTATQVDAPADLSLASVASDILIDTHLRSGLVDGVIATFRWREGQDASALEARFETAKREYRRRVRRSVSGVGPDTILLP